MNVAEALAAARRTLDEAHVPNAPREAVSLLQHAMSVERAYLIAHPEIELPRETREKYASFVSRRAEGEPFQYIVGVQEFYGLAFNVTPDVLIPRPETEILVGRAVEFLRPIRNPRFCEIGTGSGCITIAVLHALPLTQAVAVDISKSALAVARRNAGSNHVAERVRFLQSDIFDQVREERFDAILSNPPYVPNADISTLQIEVREHEPHTALAGGEDGLNVVKRIVANSPRYLRDGGRILMEIGFNQAALVDRLMDRSRWGEVEFLPDLQGIPRILSARLRQNAMSPNRAN